MTAVPKPLKFLRPHYDELTAVYEKWPAGNEKVRLSPGNITDGADRYKGFACGYAVRSGYDIWR